MLCLHKKNTAQPFSANKAIIVGGITALGKALHVLNNWLNKKLLLSFNYQSKFSISWIFFSDYTIQYAVLKILLHDLISEEVKN